MLLKNLQEVLKNIADVEGNILSNYATPIVWNNSEKYDIMSVSNETDTVCR